MLVEDQDGARDLLPGADKGEGEVADSAAGEAEGEGINGIGEVRPEIDGEEGLQEEGDVIQGVEEDRDGVDKEGTNVVVE